MSRYMLDTDISSYFIRGASRDLDDRVRVLPNDEICISVITRYELLFGLELKPEAITLKALVASFLQRMTTLPFDNSAATTFAVVSARLRQEGIGMGTMDAMIASHALSLNLTVVTNNVKHFEVVPGLRVENWIGVH
jgi:tRNA(fMet)-specific endonuclease VapC